MGNISPQGRAVFRDFVVDGNPNSGAHEPVKGEVRALIDAIDQSLDNAILGLTTNITTVQTRALSTPPTSPVTGQFWIVGPSPTGAWAGRFNNLAQWDGDSYVFTVPTDGAIVSVLDEMTLYGWDTSAVRWVPYMSDEILLSRWASAAGVVGLLSIIGTKQGQVAQVIGDAGNHADPVAVGNPIVPNEGIYSWNTSPAGWRRIANVRIFAEARNFSTWNDLTNFAGVRDGQLAIVDGDAGSHTDAVSGLSVLNSGFYRWSTSATAWIYTTSMGGISRVLSRLAAPPGSPVLGSKYLVLPGATGAFLGQDNKIATRLASSWVFEDATLAGRYLVHVSSESAFYYHTGSNWSPLSTFTLSYTAWTALEALTGLVDGQIAIVEGDVGTHTDTATGEAGVANSGFYRWSSSTTRWQRIAGVGGVARVLSRLATPPGSPVAGAKYLVAPSATGAFAGHENKIATRLSSSWVFEDATLAGRFVVYVAAETALFFYNGSNWSPLGAFTINYATWAALDAVTGLVAGQLAIVDGDDGVHTDPVSGFPSTPNAGHYRWSASPAGWLRTGGLYDSTQMIGVAGTPATAVASSLNQIFVFGDAIAEDGYCYRIELFMQTAGRIWLYLVDKSGDTFTDASTYYSFDFPTAGLKTILTDIPLKAGQMWKLYQADWLGGQVAQVASGGGWGAGLYSIGGANSPLSTFDDAVVATNRFQIKFYCRGGDLASLRQRTANADEVAGLVRGGVQFVGRINAPTAGDGALPNRAFIFNRQPAREDSIISAAQCWGLKAGVSYAKVFRVVSGQMQQIGENVPVSIEEGLNVWDDDAPFPYVEVPKGCFCGLYVGTASIAFDNAAPIGSGAPYIRRLGIGGDFSTLDAAEFEEITTNSIQFGFTLRPGREVAMERRIRALETKALGSINDEIADAKLILANLNWSAVVSVLRDGTEHKKSGFGTLSATSTGMTRYDMLAYNPDTDALEVITGAERLRDPSYGRAEVASARQIAVARLRVSENKIAPVEKWRVRNGRVKESILMIEDNIRRNKRCCPKVMQRIAARDPLSIGWGCDSIWAHRGLAGMPPEATPNGALRDVAHEVYLAPNYATDALNALPKFTSIALGMGNDSAGPVHTRVGPGWGMIEELEKRGWILNPALGAQSLWVYNWSIPGYAYSNYVSSTGTRTSFFNTILAHCVTNNVHLFFLGFGQNEVGNVETYARARHAIQALLDIGVEVVVVDPPLRNRAVVGGDGMFTAGWEYTCNSLRAAAEEKGVAHISMIPLYAARFAAALDIHPLDHCEADRNNGTGAGAHPGLAELARMREEISKNFF